MDLAGRARALRLAIFDVDGVFTDGRLHYSPAGEEIKVFHVRDGLGIKRLQTSGVEVAIISGRASDAVTLRMAELGVRHVFQGDHDKLPLFERLLAEIGCEAGQTAFMGDDLPDLAVMRQVGLAACPADAVAAVAEMCHWQSGLPGGRGAVREFCDFVIRARSSES
jgi:3-deoxy-D-manno-octulosonate 8-phosphate phosphatase (KDO 8-P phosphatase)